MVKMILSKMNHAQFPNHLQGMCRELEFPIQTLMVAVFDAGDLVVKAGNVLLTDGSCQPVKITRKTRYNRLHEDLS